MENTKDFIIDEAYKLFLNHSYEAVSISDISNAIGLTKGALYHHFKNKEELFRSVVDKFLVLPTFDGDIHNLSLGDYVQMTLQITERYVRRIFDITQEYSPLNHVSLMTDAMRHYPGFLEQFDGHTSTEIKKSTVVLENAIKSGEIRDNINVKLIALNLYSISIGLAGTLIRNNSVNEGITLLKNQITEFYKLLKKE